MVELGGSIQRPGAKRPLPTGRNAGERQRPALRLGLINNMADAALEATERQFSSLLSDAAKGLEVDLRFFHLPAIERGASAREMMRGRYASVDRLPGSRLDGLIVTGAEPRTEKLTDETYWPSLAGVIDWAQSGTISAVWSCLAAHAAVLRLDGVARGPLERKLSGVFLFETDRDHPLLAGAPVRVRTPHSRLNGLAEADLLAHGYRVLNRSAQAGVDAFVRDDRSLFLQGHPEYEPDSLAREYRRDIARFLAGEGRAPRPPSNYFDSATEEALSALTSRSPSQPHLAPEFDVLIRSAELSHSWRPYAVQLFANWLAGINRRKFTEAAAPAFS